jgi:hypothetical protein
MKKRKSIFQTMSKIGREKKEGEIRLKVLYEAVDGMIEAKEPTYYGLYTEQLEKGKKDTEAREVIARVFRAHLWMVTRKLHGFPYEPTEEEKGWEEEKNWIVREAGEKYLIPPYSENL